MAAAGTPFSFSIREYAVRARARAEGGSWPFGGDAGLLPPVEVRRFLWWQDEAAAVEEEEVEVERRTAAKRRKRSVAELFAAVPRVPRVPRGGQWCAKPKGKAAAKGKAEKDKGNPVLAVSFKTKRKKKKAPAGIDDGRGKEKNSGVKVSSISISKSFQHSIKKRESKNSSCKKKEKQEVPVLLDKKSKKGNRKSVLERHKKDMTNSVQAQNICKKQSKTGFNTVLNTTDMRFKLSSCKSKHVTFSDGTDIFGRTRYLPEDNTKQPQTVQTFQQPTQESHDRRDTDEQQLVYEQEEAISGPVEITSSLSENVVPAGVCRTIPLTKTKNITILGNSVDLNHCIETSHGSNCLNSTSLACLSSKAPCQRVKGVNSRLNGDNGLSPDVECLGEQNHTISQASFNPVNLAAKAVSGDMSTLSQPSSSCLYNRSSSTFEEKAVANYHFRKVSSELLRSGNVVRSISSSTGKPAQATDCISACTNMQNHNDYVSLPINSRGEFVKVHPGGIPNSVDMFRRQCLGENSSCPSVSPIVFHPMLRTDHVNLRPNYHARQGEFVSIPNSDDMFRRQCLGENSSCPLVSPIVFHPMLRTDHVNLRPNYHARQDEFVKVHPGGIPNSDDMSRRQRLGENSSCPSVSPIVFSPMLRTDHVNLRPNYHAQQGEFVSIPNSDDMFRRQCLGENSSCPSVSPIVLHPMLRTDHINLRQCEAEDQFFQGTRRNVFPKLFHGGLVDPPSARRISHGERQPSGNPSHISFVPAAVRVPGTNSFRTSGHNQQPELETVNNPYVQQPVMGNQAQSNAEDMVLGSMSRMHTQTVAPKSSFNSRNNIRNLMEKGPASYQSSYLTQQLSNMAQRTTASSFASGYAVQKAPGLTTQTKFTSLRPLLPSVIPSVVTAFHPSVPIPYPASNPSAPGSAISGIESTMMGSRPEGLQHLRNCKRPAEKDDVSLTLPKKPCTAAPDVPFGETNLEFRGPRPDAQPSDTPICLDDEPEADLRLGNRESHPTCSKAVSTTRPVKLNPGAKHVLQPSASNVYQENPWPVVHSVTPPLTPGE